MQEIPKSIQQAAMVVRLWAEEQNWTTGEISGLYIGRTELMLNGRAYFRGLKAGKEELREELRELLGVGAKDTDENS